MKILRFIRQIDIHLLVIFVIISVLAAVNSGLLSIGNMVLFYAFIIMLIITFGHTIVRLRTEQRFIYFISNSFMALLFSLATYGIKLLF